MEPLEIGFAVARRQFGVLSRFSSHDDLVVATEFRDDPTAARCLESSAAIGWRGSHRLTVTNGRRDRRPL